MKITNPEKSEVAILFQAASVAVLLRGPFHGDRVQYKFGVLEPNN